MLLMASAGVEWLPGVLLLVLEGENVNSRLSFVRTDVNQITVSTSGLKNPNLSVSHGRYQALYA
jgi:hypothetical protein